MFPEGRALEFLVVAIVALVVVGPKDLPMLLRKLGQFMAKLRGMAAEFRASFDEMARQSELDELRKEVEALRRGQMADIAQTGHAEATQIVDEIHQNLAEVGVQLHPPMSYQYSEAPSEPAPATTIAAVEPPPKAKPKPRAAKPKAATVKAKSGAAATSAAKPKTAARKPAAKAAKSSGPKS